MVVKRMAPCRHGLRLVCRLQVGVERIVSSGEKNHELFLILMAATMRTFFSACVCGYLLYGRFVGDCSILLFNSRIWSAASLAWPFLTSASLGIDPREVQVGDEATQSVAAAVVSVQSAPAEFTAADADTLVDEEREAAEVPTVATHCCGRA